MRIPLTAALACAVWPPPSALAAEIESTPIEAQATAAPAAPIPAPSFSSELLDPAGVTRFHLVTRATFGDGDAMFSSSSAWSFEARTHVRIVEGIAVSAVLPFGLFVPRDGAANEFFLGNLGIGATFGAKSDLGGVDLLFGGGLDIYLPTTPEPTTDRQRTGETLVAAIRAYEPQLYIADLLSFRARGYAGLDLDPLALGLELGLVPGITTETKAELVLLFTAAARASFFATPEVEPYLEVGCATQIAGVGEVTPPLLFTPGVRLHVFEMFDPAVFVSINMVETSAVIFGVDLASALRPRGKAARRAEERDDHDDFLDF